MMSTATEEQIEPTMATPPAVGESDQLVVLRRITRDGYRRFLKLRGEVGMPRAVYPDGELQLVSPSYTHEFFKERINTLLRKIFLTRRVAHIATAQTTFRRKARRGGVEGNLSFCIANVAGVRGKRRFDLRTDPPPDLAVEASVSLPFLTSAEVADWVRRPPGDSDLDWASAARDWVRDVLLPRRG